MSLGIQTVWDKRKYGPIVQAFQQDLFSLLSILIADPYRPFAQRLRADRPIIEKARQKRTGC
ncbi:MAG: hypothetical protein CMN67_07325 [Sphingomonadaceae bacterium]|nr:hypothetical protein [Sphingomonadaceae bacterium]